MQEVVVAKPVYVGLGSELLNSWLFDAVVVFATLYLVYWTMAEGVMPPP